MPKRVDHELRRRQITDAVCRITLRGGLGAATFREVAAEAGVSVNLVQYYFGTKDRLLDATQEHVGERSSARLTAWIEATDGSPRAVLGAYLQSFIPSDEESRVAMLMYVALAAQTSVAVQQSQDDRPDRQTEAQMVQEMVVDQLTKAELREGVDPEVEARVITAMLPGLGNYALDGTMTTSEAYAAIDYHLDRLFTPTADSAKEQDHAARS